jgi:hypothetical protein
MLAVLVLTPAALAAGGARLSSGSAGSRAALPTTNIQGSPAKFSPNSLNVVSRATTTNCTKAQASFLMVNKESKNEKVVFTVQGQVVLTVTVKPHAGEYICIKKGAKGTAIGKLSDGKKLTVNVT